MRFCLLLFLGPVPLEFFGALLAVWSRSYAYDVYTQIGTCDFDRTGVEECDSDCRICEVAARGRNAGD